MAAGEARLLVPERHWRVAGSPASRRIIETPCQLPIVERYRPSLRSAQRDQGIPYQDRL
jgi:hypothetical protein